MDPAFLRRLYRHSRNEDGQRVIFQNDHSFRGDWVNLDSPAARALIEAYVEEHSDQGTKKARQEVEANLEAQPWSEILGIDDPPIACKVKIHGRKWGIKFQSGDAKLRGRHLRNEQLPPLPIPDDSDGVVEVATVLGGGQVSASESHQTPATTPAEAAADVFRKAGFPT